MIYLKYLLQQIQLKEVKFLLILDSLLLPFALFTAVLLRLGGEWDIHLTHHIWVFFALPFWTIPLFIHLGLYKAVLRYLDEKIVLIVFVGVSLSVLILIGVIYLAGIYAFPKTALIIFWVFALAYIGGSRFILRGLLRNINEDTKIRVAIYGAGAAGIQICLSLQNSSQYVPIIFIDDDLDKVGSVIRGVKIYSAKNIEAILKEKNIHNVLLAIPSASHAKKREILESFRAMQVTIKSLPGVAELISGEVTINDIKEVEIEDLLGRDPVKADFDLMQKNIVDKVVLITGAGGSIGSELVRQIGNLGPKTLILLDQSEYALYSIKSEMLNGFPNAHIIDILGSVTDQPLISKIISQFKVNTIYHAAAYKHVPIVELNPIAGIKNNVLGTYIIASEALKYNVDNMVLISTDKAVRPTNVMGASKRFAEMILQAMQSKSSHTIFSMVRFGNVLGSSGSVVPLFREQIKAHGPITVTHPKIIRYFMTIPEAIELVIQAGNMAEGGEVFVLDMGEPVKIVDLARRMIQLSGFSVKDANNPNGDIEIKFTGLRPGEKLYEELLIDGSVSQTSHARIMKANETYLDYDVLINLLESLKSAIDVYDISESIKVITNTVIEYSPQQSSTSFT